MFEIHYKHIPLFKIHIDQYDASALRSPIGNKPSKTVKPC